MTSNSFTRTGSYADLLHCWGNEDYKLDGLNYELHYCEAISRDQAVDGEGQAMYDEYIFHKPGDEFYNPSRTFTAEQVEQFAQTWWTQAEERQNGK